MGLGHLLWRQCLKPCRQNALPAELRKVSAWHQAFLDPVLVAARNVRQLSVRVSGTGGGPDGAFELACSDLSFSGPVDLALPFGKPGPTWQKHFALRQIEHLWRFPNFVGISH